MAKNQAKSNMIQKNESQHSASRDQEKQSQSDQKEQAFHKTSNLSTIRQSRDQFLSQSNRIQKFQAIPSSQASKTLKGRKRPQTLFKPSTPRKRKRGQKNQEVKHPSRTQVEPLQPSPDCIIEGKREASSVKLEGNTSIEHWRETGHWPKILFEPCPNINQDSCKKRLFSVMSYTQSVKQGINPSAYTSEYEEVLAEAGIIMHDRQVTILNKCRKFCVTLFDSEYEVPENSLFGKKSFWTTLAKARRWNEARVLRDITPCIVPSAELLSARGVLGLEHLTEEISAEWIKCIPLAGPRPKPDFAVGLSSSVFTDKEIQKLKYYKTPQKPTLVTENMYFPFFVCEVKNGMSALDIADRQNAHSASMAVNAILQLYQKKENSQKSQIVSQAKRFNREILIISLSHNYNTVRIYGHYALIKKNKTTFYRHLIRSFDIEDNEGKNKWIAYHFVRKIYDTFSLTHLERIQSGIALLPESKPESSIYLEGKSALPGPQEMLPSQDASSSKKQRLTASSVLQQQLESQQQQLESQQQQLESQQQQFENQQRQFENQQRQFENQQRQFESRQRQFESQTQEHNNQIKHMMQEAKQREDRLKEEANQKEDRLKEEANQKEDRLKKEANQKEDRLREELAQEKAESKQRHKELLDLLKSQQKQNTKQ